MAESDGLTRRERERLRHRAEILEAARKVVEAKGLAGLTVEEVAREAEFAVGSIYRHFRSKDEMVELLVATLAEPLIEEVDAVAASGAPFEEQLQRLVRAIHDHLVEDRPLIQAFHAAAGPLPTAGTAAGDQLFAVRQRLFDAVAQVVAAGQRAGVVSGDDPASPTLVLVGLLSGVLRWASFVSTGEDIPTLVCRHFLAAVRRT